MARSNRSMQRVSEALADKGLELEVEKFPSSTRTAADAARSVGCEVAQIAKSLVFRRQDSGEPVLVVASGKNRVDLEKTEPQVGGPLEMADAAFVREKTGFAIGGVPPVGHGEELAIFLDRDLFEYERIWAAAGAPDAVFAVSPEQLLQLTGGTIIDVC